MTSKKHYGKQTGRPITHELPTPAGGVRLETFVPWTLVRRGLKKRVITPLDAPQEFLSEATRERAQVNPLRVLDDKRESVQAQLEQAPLMVDHLCTECAQHYDRVRHFLALMGVRWTEAPRLVRGLDYYTRTTFEFVHSLLGAQSAIGGGGRYDGLMETLGGPALSGIGYAMGTDRTLLAREAENLAPLAKPAVTAYVIGLGDTAEDFSVGVVDTLRRAGVGTGTAFGGRGLKGAMKAADRSGARWAIIIGDDEVAARVVQLKDLQTGTQTAVAVSDIVGAIDQEGGT